MCATSPAGSDSRIGIHWPGQTIDADTLIWREIWSLTPLKPSKQGAFYVIGPFENPSSVPRVRLGIGHTET